MFFEDLHSTTAPPHDLVDHLCVRCGREVLHIFHGDSDCLLCSKPLAAHEEMLQGQMGIIHRIRREGDEAGLAFLWCRACAVASIAERDHIGFITTLFAAVPEAVRCNEVITAGVLKRFKN